MLHCLMNLPRHSFIAVLLALVLLKTGIAEYTLFKQWALIAQNPFENPFWENTPINPEDALAFHFLMWSHLLPFLCWCVGMVSASNVFWVSLFFAFAFFWGLMRCTFCFLPEQSGRIACLLFAIFPVSGIGFFMVGMDSFTLFLMGLTFIVGLKINHLTLNRGGIIAFLLGILLGMQHFEQGFLGVVALLFAICFSKQQSSGLSFSFCLSWVLGIVLGKLLLVLLFLYWQQNVPTRSEHFFRNAASYWSAFSLNFQWAWFAGLGLGWVAVAHYVCQKRDVLPFLLPLLALCLLPIIAYDYTRVVAVATFPLLLQFVFLNADFLKNFPKATLNTLFVAWLFLPFIYFFGRMQSAQGFYTLLVHFFNL